MSHIRHYVCHAAFKGSPEKNRTVRKRAISKGFFYRMIFQSMAGEKAPL